MSGDEHIELGTANVFADLAFDDPEEEVIKATLIREFRAIVKRKGLTQGKVAEIIGVKQPDVSAIVNGNTGKFSITRLVRFLDRLDYRVDVVVRRKRRPRADAVKAA